MYISLAPKRILAKQKQVEAWPKLFDLLLGTRLSLKALCLIALGALCLWQCFLVARVRMENLAVLPLKTPIGYLDLECSDTYGRGYGLPG